MNSANKYLDRVIFWVSNQPGVSSPASVCLLFLFPRRQFFLWWEPESYRRFSLSTSDNMRILYFISCSGECVGPGNREINTVNDQWCINGSNTPPNIFSDWRKYKKLINIPGAVGHVSRASSWKYSDFNHKQHRNNLSKNILNICFFMSCKYYRNS